MQRQPLPPWAVDSAGSPSELWLAAAAQLAARQQAAEREAEFEQAAHKQRVSVKERVVAQLKQELGSDPTQRAVIAGAEYEYEQALKDLHLPLRSGWL
eukprot:5861257-Pleurochrysis_carterae.AAC.1